MKRSKLVFLIIIYSLAFCALYSVEDFEIIKKIRDKKKITVLIAAGDNYPFYYESDSEIKGYDIELAKKIADALKVDLEIIRSSVPASEFAADIVINKADIGISKIKKNLKDALIVSYSKPYYKLGYVLLINRRKYSQYKGKNSYEELIRNKKSVICSLSSDLYKGYLNGFFPGNKIKYFNSVREIADELIYGESVCAFLDEVEAKILFKKDPSLGVKLEYYGLKTISDELYIASSWKNKILIDYLNIFLGLYYRKITIDELINY